MFLFPIVEWFYRCPLCIYTLNIPVPIWPMPFHYVGKLTGWCPQSPSITSEEQSHSNRHCWFAGEFGQSEVENIYINNWYLTFCKWNSWIMEGFVCFVAPIFFTVSIAFKIWDLLNLNKLEHVLDNDLRKLNVCIYSQVWIQCIANPPFTIPLLSFHRYNRLTCLKRSLAAWRSMNDQQHWGLHVWNFPQRRGWKNTAPEKTDKRYNIQWYVVDGSEIPFPTTWDVSNPL